MQLKSSLTTKPLVYVNSSGALIDGIDLWSCAWKKQLLCATVKSSTYLILVTDGVYNIPVAVSSVSGNQLTTFA